MLAFTVLDTGISLASKKRIELRPIRQPIPRARAGRRQRPRGRRVSHILYGEGSPSRGQRPRDDRRGERVSGPGWLNSIDAKRGYERDRRTGVEPTSSLAVSEHNRVRA